VLRNVAAARMRNPYIRTASYNALQTLLIFSKVAVSEVRSSVFCVKRVA